MFKALCPTMDDTLLFPLRLPDSAGSEDLAGCWAGTPGHLGRGSCCLTSWDAASCGPWSPDVGPGGQPPVCAHRGRLRRLQRACGVTSIHGGPWGSLSFDDLGPEFEPWQAALSLAGDPSGWRFPLLGAPGPLPRGLLLPALPCHCVQTGRPHLVPPNYLPYFCASSHSIPLWVLCYVPRSRAAPGVEKTPGPHLMEGVQSFEILCLSGCRWPCRACRDFRDRGVVALSCFLVTAELSLRASWALCGPLAGGTRVGVLGAWRPRCGKSAGWEGLAPAGPGGRCTQWSSDHGRAPRPKR